MNKKVIIDYLENNLNFRDYTFKSALLWKSFYKKGHNAILNPSEKVLNTAVKNNIGTLKIYLDHDNSKRIKQVYSSSYEVFHLWASQSQAYARQGGRITRAFFEGSSAYSYGKHYEVGRFVIINGKQVALINTKGYSHTTSKHISEAKGAVSHLPTIEVGPDFDWKKGLLSMQDNLINRLFNELNRLSFWKGSESYDAYDQKDVKTFNDLCIIVGMKHLQLFPNKDTIDLLNEYIKERLIRQDALDIKKNTPEYIAKKEEKKAKDRELIIFKHAEEIAAWKKGGPYTNATTGLYPQIIRVRNGIVETSSRAAISLIEARNALKNILNGSIKKNASIGNYKFSNIKGDIVTIGCHQISLQHAQEILNNG